jgi:ankyrin repeat protein
MAAQLGHLAIVRCLVAELGVDVNQADKEGYTPLFIAAANGHLAVVRCLIKELGADVNQAMYDGSLPLSVSASNGHLPVVRCLIEEFGADVNHPRKDGVTSLMLAVRNGHSKIVKYLIKHGADPQASTPRYGTLIDVSKTSGAPAEQTAYLKAKTQCSNPGCSGAGLKKCTGCKQARYCCGQCQLAHWPAHKADCKKVAKDN